MPWRLIVAPRAEKDLADLPARDGEALSRALERLVDNPGSVNLKKLAGREALWRLRVGRWRAILRLDNAAGVIHVLRVLPRSRAYRD